MVEALLTTGTFPEKAARNHELRHQAVEDILANHKVKSVLDLGCGDGRFIERLVGDARIEKVVGLDNDPYRLEVGRQRLVEHFGSYKAGLTHGTFLDLDESLGRFDAAVMIEAIEHISENDLPILKKELFGAMQPGLVVITTPNATRRLTPEQLDCRGHLFEWDIPEFENWTREVVQVYPYTVEISQLNGPTFERGTQIATFQKA